MRRRPLFLLVGSVLTAAALAVGAITVATRYASSLRVGRQSDRSYIVSTGQRILPGTISFRGRPIDLSLHPSGEFFAILGHRSVFLANRQGVIPNSLQLPGSGASYTGCQWSPDGLRLFVSLAAGQLEHYKLSGRTLVSQGRILLVPPEEKRNPVPGGMAITRDGTRLFVACANRGAVVVVNLLTNTVLKEWKVQNIPFSVRLSTDENTLIVTNWAGRPAEREDDEEEADSGGVGVFVDDRGIAASGTVTLIRRDTGERTNIPVGLHPAGIAVAEDLAYVANAASDSISEISIPRARVLRTIPIKWGRKSIFGSMPNTLQVRNGRIYVCNGGDNAVCEIDVKSGRVLGFRPAGFFPVNIRISPDGRTAYVINTKGNGSVAETNRGRAGNAHDIEGTVSILDLTADLDAATETVIANNGWRTARETLNPDLPVYRGKIKHVLYIIKENRTYDEIFGDMPQGNGSPRLCGLGEPITPNHHALAREFTLFDNAYVNGTNSAEGHQWAMEGLANDYIERFYGGYTRSYPFDGGDAMAYSNGGFIWDAAKKKNKSIRVYGEFCAAKAARFEPRKPANWLEAWQDRERGTNRFKITAATTVAGLRPYIHPRVLCWPLLMSDQWRADEFIKEYRQFSNANRVPNLMILTLPCDHTSGTTYGYPTPRAQVADNDLALGRVVEAVSNSPQWKETCIFVMEDDAQAGPDHVDGHRTVCLVLSPYTRRGFVDSTMVTQLSVLHSIELMLGLNPMTKFDALATPFAACFMDTPDTRPFAARVNRIRLDEMNKPRRGLRGRELTLAKQSDALDWSGVDTADWATLNRIVWHSLHGVDTPYPTRDSE